MISMNNYKANWLSLKPTGKLFVGGILLLLMAVSACGYSFRDVTIPPEVKTIKVNYIENKATYINPQLSSRLTEQIQQKIINQTRLTRTNADDAHYQISGYVNSYAVTTVAVAQQQASGNRLTVGVHIVFNNTLSKKVQEFDVSRNFDFPSTLTLQQAEANLLTDIVRNMSDEIFNRIFSNW